MREARVTAANLRHSFVYGANGSGELTKVVLPLGGELEWVYASIGVQSGRQVREVTQRLLRAGAGATTYTYTITRDPADATRPLHSMARLNDASGNGAKEWYFYWEGPTTDYNGLMTDYKELDGGVVKMFSHNGWSLDATGRPRLHFKGRILDPGQAAEKVSWVGIGRDIWGNVLLQLDCDFANPSVQARTTEWTYADNLGPYIKNRVTQVKVTPQGGAPVVVQTTAYDVAPGFGCGQVVHDAPGVRQQDTANYGTGEGDALDSERSDAVGGA